MRETKEYSSKVDSSAIMWSVFTQSLSELYQCLQNSAGYTRSEKDKGYTRNPTIRNKLEGLKKLVDLNHFKSI